jgi:hypothetical protein
MYHNHNMLYLRVLGRKVEGESVTNVDIIHSYAIEVNMQADKVCNEKRHHQLF